jgi:hypothetical protein
MLPSWKGEGKAEYMFCSYTVQHSNWTIFLGNFLRVSPEASRTKLWRIFQQAMHPWMWQATRVQQAWLESWFTVSIGELQSDKTSLGNWARVGSGSLLRLLEGVSWQQTLGWMCSDQLFGLAFDYTVRAIYVLQFMVMSGQTHIDLS